PKNIIVSSADLSFPLGFSLFVQHNYTSSIPLNDANSVFAGKYHLVQLKTFWKPQQKDNRSIFQVFAGADNLLNTSYSLGNDLNAVGNRYYNPAAGLNFYGGISVNWK
ncbi:MAG TPA: TonB-dependent receptor, partial [Sphingobacteriaceae bacterium]